MDEPAFLNYSSFTANALPILDRAGAQSRVVIVKATYALNTSGALVMSDIPRTIRLGDEPWGSPEIPDIKFPGDFCAAKPGTDVVVIGHAVPARRGDTSVDVGIRVANRTKTLRVHGPRQWYQGVGGVVPGPSAAMPPTPLAWSLAFGGSDFSDPRRPLEEPRNPVGRGVTRDINLLVGKLAPQIEDPAAPVGFAGFSYVPVGCGPVGRNFRPRRDTMGTYDHAWLESVYPARPADYQEVHENCAPPDLVFAEPLVGGEPVVITSVGRAATTAFRIPRVRIVIQAAIDGAVTERRPHLDTVVVDADAQVVELVWRGLFRCPSRMHNRFTAIRVLSKEYVS